MKDSKFWVKKISLIPHPEGGFYKEVYRSAEAASAESLPERFSTERNYSTAIYYLLESGDFSAFHRIKSDEIWHFYDGEPLNIYIIDNNGALTIKTLGLSEKDNVYPQVIVPATTWFAAKPVGSFTLAGCTVSPGFDFHDFEMADNKSLKEKYPEHSEIIDKLTH